MTYSNLFTLFHVEHVVRAFINTSLQPQATNETVISGGVSPGTSPAAAATSTSSAPSTGQTASGE